MDVAKQDQGQNEGTWRKRFPDGLEYKIVYDTTPFIEESVEEVFH